MKRDYNEELSYIVSKLFEDGIIKKLIKPYGIHTNDELNNELKKDLEMELVIFLLEYKDKKKLVQMYERNELTYFISKVASNQVSYTESSFYYKYRKYYAMKDGLISHKISNNVDEGEWN